MSNPIDDYLKTIESADRAVLQNLRERIHSLVPGLEECISYGLPTFKLKGKALAGFYRYAKHFSYFPFSGGVLGQMGDAIKDYKYTKSSLHFTEKQGLPDKLLKELIELRRAEAGV